MKRALSYAERHNRKRAGGGAVANFAGVWGVPNKQSSRPEGTERWKGKS